MKKVDFLVVGAQKSGTSALYRYFLQHPQIEMARKKEVHFFDDEAQFERRVDYGRYHRFFDWDQANLRGECTPNYMFWTPCMERIHEYNPGMKIIAILRNPVERAYSQWNMEWSRGADPLGFSDAIRHEHARCPKPLSRQFRVWSYTKRGFYAEQIRRIWRYFSRHQTLFIRQEEFRDHPRFGLNQISELLGIEAFEYDEPRDVHSRPYSQPMSDRDRRYLTDRFRDDIRQVERLLDWDCAQWLSQGESGPAH